MEKLTTAPRASEPIFFKRLIQFFRLILCVQLLLLPNVLFAAAEINPFATVGYLHNSNIFYLAPETPSPFANLRSDSVTIFTGGVDSLFDIGRQQINLSAQADRIKYIEYNYVDNTAYSGSAGLDWELGRLFDGAIAYSYQRSMVPFVDFADPNIAANQKRTSLQIGKNKDLSASFNIALTPVWRLESSGVRTVTDSPRDGAPDLRLVTNTYRGGLSYIGVSKVTVGFEGLQVRGEIGGAIGAANEEYKQTTGQFTATYIVSELSNFAGNIGLTRREQLGADPLSDITWALGYTRAITGKTTVEARYSKGIIDYLLATGLGSQQNTEAYLRAAWQATAKSQVVAEMLWVHSAFQDEQFGDPNAGRRDTILSPLLRVNYQLSPWLQVSPYARYDKRNSNSDLFRYTATVVGIDLTAALPE